MITQERGKRQNICSQRATPNRGPPPTPRAHHGPKKPLELARTEAPKSTHITTMYSCGSSTSSPSAPPRACIATRPPSGTLETVGEAPAARAPVPVRAVRLPGGAGSAFDLSAMAARGAAAGRAVGAGAPELTDL